MVHSITFVGNLFESRLYGGKLFIVINDNVYDVNNLCNYIIKWFHKHPIYVI